jgi:hypothetical protein
MLKKKLSKSGGYTEPQPATAPNTKTSNRPKGVYADKPVTAKAADAPGSNPDPASYGVGFKEREIIEDIVDALRDIDIEQLPESPRGDTIRCLQWALEYLMSPPMQPQDQHRVPFNFRLTKEEAVLGQEAIEEVWRISSWILSGLDQLRTRGFVSRWGGECPACWSPGDFYNSIKGAREALVRLEALNDKLYQIDSEVEQLISKRSNH